MLSQIIFKCGCSPAKRLNYQLNCNNNYKMQVQGLLERVGIGPTHKWMLIALSFVEIINGYKIVMISLISPHLKNQWGLQQEVKNIPLAFYCGIITGSLLAGSLANISGRKITLFLGQIFQVISSLLLIFVTQFLTFLFVLILAGIGFGITLIMANTLLSEQMPQKYRGKSLLFISFIAILGKFFAVIAAYAYQLSNWRKPEIYVAITGFLLSIIILIKIPQSLRVLLLKGQLQRSKKIYAKLLKQQNKSQITEAQMKIMKELSQNSYKKQTKKTHFQDIFKNSMLKTTVMLSITWFVINYMFYGQLFIMPFFFENKQTSVVTQFTQMLSGQVPSILLTFNMIERQFFGRKNSIVLFFLVLSALNFTLIYLQSVFVLSVSRLAMKSIMQILYPLTTQSYSTLLRSSGLAFCAGIGRLGSIIMPLVVYTLYQIEPSLVFVSFMLVSVLGLLSILNVRETLHHSLDDFQFEHPNQQSSILSKQEIEVKNGDHKIQVH